MIKFLTKIINGIADKVFPPDPPYSDDWITTPTLDELRALEGHDEDLAYFASLKEH